MPRIDVCVNCEHFTAHHAYLAVRDMPKHINPKPPNPADFRAFAHCDLICSTSNACPHPTRGCEAHFRTAPLPEKCPFKLEIMLEEQKA